MQGYVSVAKLLVSYFADVNAKGPNDWTPLHQAACDGRLDLVEVILAAHSKLKLNIVAQTDTGATPMFLAAQNGHQSVVQRFCFRSEAISTRQKNGWAPIHVAAANNHVEVINTLLANNAFVDFHSSNGSTPLHLASQNGHMDVAVLLVDKGAQLNLPTRDGSTPLHVASEVGQEKIVDFLINKKAQVDAKNLLGDTPLMRAVLGGHRNIVQLLISSENNRANANIADNNGLTPLMLACTMNRLDIAELLITKGGADVQQQDKNCMTCLHHACKNGFTRLCQLLLECRASPLLPDTNGRTPLHVASQNGHRDCVVALKTSMGSLFSANVQTQDGFTPLFLASQGGHIKVIH